MSRNYDNWERMVKAVLDRENLRQIARAPSLSSSFSSIRSDFSFPIEQDLKLSSGLRKFTFNDLKMATRNFRPSAADLLGVGISGLVFKGYVEENGTAPAKFGTGLTVSIKILNYDVLEDHGEFMAKVNFLGHLFHPNLENLVGYCIEDHHRLLVYEFIPRRSLESHIFTSLVLSASPISHAATASPPLLFRRRQVQTTTTPLPEAPPPTNPRPPALKLTSHSSLFSRQRPTPPRLRPPPSSESAATTSLRRRQSPDDH